MPRVSHRLERVAKELQREVGTILLSEAGDPRLHFVSVTRVEPAPDLRTARVFFSIIGDGDAQQACLQALERAKTFIQKQVNSRMKMRFTPILSFHKDDSIAGAVNVCQIIDAVVPHEEPPEAEEEEGESQDSEATGGQEPI